MSAASKVSFARSFDSLARAVDYCDNALGALWTDHRVTPDQLSDVASVLADTANLISTAVSGKLGSLQSVLSNQPLTSADAKRAIELQEQVAISTLNAFIAAGTRLEQAAMALTRMAGAGAAIPATTNLVEQIQELRKGLADPDYKPRELFKVGVNTLYPVGIYHRLAPLLLTLEIVESTALAAALDAA